MSATNFFENIMKPQFSGTPAGQLAPGAGAPFAGAFGGLPFSLNGLNGMNNSMQGAEDMMAV